MNGKFDEATEHLQKLVAFYPEGFEWGEQCKAAIAVLKAAGKVDKSAAIAHFTPGMTEDPNCQVCGATLALLAALPEVKK